MEIPRPAAGSFIQPVTPATSRTPYLQINAAAKHRLWWRCSPEFGRLLSLQFEVRQHSAFVNPCSSCSSASLLANTLGHIPEHNSLCHCLHSCSRGEWLQQLLNKWLHCQAGCGNNQLHTAGKAGIFALQKCVEWGDALSKQVREVEYEWCIVDDGNRAVECRFL